MTNKTTFAQQAAAAARKSDYDNASVLYYRAGDEADYAGKHAKANRHRENAVKFERMANR